MEVIHNNPFRVLGLPVSASTREITKRVSDLELYAEMGKTVCYETDYPFLSPVERTIDAVKDAANQIETMESRFFYSLFWFWEGNIGDELAFDELKEAKIDTAMKLLKKQSDSSASEKSLSLLYQEAFKYGGNGASTFSSEKNLSLLYMALARNGRKNGILHVDFFSDGITWAGKVMNAGFLSEYAKLIVGKQFIFDEDKVVESFVDEIIKTIESRFNNNRVYQTSLRQLIPNFSNFPDKVRRRVANRFTAKDMQAIDDAIALSERHKKDSPKKANLAAKTLCDSTKKAIASLQEILGVDDYTYQSYADKLATAIEACGIAYFNYHRENENGIDPGEDTLEIAKYASRLATAVNTKKRIDEGIEVIGEWVEGKSERERMGKIGDSIDFIVSQINGLPDTEYISKNHYGQFLQSAKSFVNDCKVPLEEIGKVLGAEDETYLSLSNAVASNAMGMCIVYANEIHKPADVLDILKTVKTFAMEPDLRERFNNNFKILLGNLANQELSNLTKQSQKSGCYIATMVYGDYDAPQVLVLRRFRDDVLSQVGPGRFLIKIYYRLSPGFVNRFGRFRFVHRSIRCVLDRVVRRLM